MVRISLGDPTNPSRVAGKGEIGTTGQLQEMGAQHQGLGVAAREVEMGRLPAGGGARWRGRGEVGGGGHKREEVGDGGGGARATRPSSWACWPKAQAQNWKNRRNAENFLF